MTYDSDYEEIREAVMAQEKNTAERYSDASDIMTVKIADDVVALIAAFANSYTASCAAPLSPWAIQRG